VSGRLSEVSSSFRISFAPISPIAVVHDFVHPSWPGWLLGGKGQNAGSTEPSVRMRRVAMVGETAACSRELQPPDCRGTDGRWEVGFGFCECVPCPAPHLSIRTTSPSTWWSMTSENFARAFVETDIAEADRETVIRNFLIGRYSNALRVVAFNTAEGWSRDVSEDIADEVLERAFDADDNLSEDTKRFIDRHVTPGEKRPAAPSVHRDTAAAHAWRVGTRKTGV
jgi:hypothetical protein